MSEREKQLDLFASPSSARVRPPEAERLERERAEAAVIAARLPLVELLADSAVG